MQNLQKASQGWLTDFVLIQRFWSPMWAFHGQMGLAPLSMVFEICGKIDFFLYFRPFWLKNKSFVEYLLCVNGMFDGCSVYCVY